MAKGLLPAALLCAARVAAAPASQDPYIGYIYPAGGQSGTTVRVTVGGQRLRGVRGVVCGPGVRATIAGYVGASGLLTPLQQEELRRRLLALRPQGSRRAPERAASTPQRPVVLPDFPDLRDIEHQTPAQLRRLTDKYLNRAKRPKPPIAEEVTLDVSIDPSAAPGDREIRLLTPTGLSNPRIFQVGRLPELRTPDEANQDTVFQPASPPFTLNGRIGPGDVNRVPLVLRAGQSLAFVAQARHLIPYLADAVPGWFQPILTLRDAGGRELAWADHCGFDPDPVITYKVRKDGAYLLEIRDTLYRGRRDFVYRVTVDDAQHCAAVLPSGSRGGVPFGPEPEFSDPFGSAAQRVREMEPNDSAKAATRTKLPTVLLGCISRPDDVDVYRFTGQAGSQLTAEVYARRAGSPLDSVLRLADPAGRCIAWNDDTPDPESGTLTHGADSHLSTRLPVSGVYTLQVADAQHHGGPFYRYAVRLGAPQPDFALRAYPSGVSIPAGGSTQITLTAFRKDGWKGDIDVALKDAPPGFALSGARIPAGSDSVRVTLLAPRGRQIDPVPLHLVGTARIGGQTVVRPVVPADQMMQAFAYEHLVPAQQLLAAVLPRGRFARPFRPAPGGRAGASRRVSIGVKPANPVTVQPRTPAAGL